MKEWARALAWAMGIYLLAAVPSLGDQEPPPVDSSQPAVPQHTTVTVPEGETLSMELKDPLNTKTTRKGDTANLEITTDVFADGKIVIPRGSMVRATVTEAHRAGRMFGKARVRLQFDHLTLPNGLEYQIFTQLSPSGWWEPTGDIKAKGESSRSRDVKKIGETAAQGALLGVLLGGGKGAAQGAAAGAAVGAIGVMMERGPELDLPPGMMFEVQLTKPLPISWSPIDQQRAETNITVPEDAPVIRRHDQPEIASTNPPVAPPSANPSSPEPKPEPPSSAEIQVPPPPAAPPSPPPAISGDEPSTEYKLQVKVNLVLVETTVRDNRGQIVDNLKKEDFVLSEDGAQQEITHFSRDELPLAVAIVVDRSGSVEPIIQKLREAALDTLSLLKPEDEVALFAFDSKCDRMEYLTKDRERIADAIARIRPGGGTNITDAVFDAELYLGRAAPSRRHAIVLVSDNQITVRGFASASDAVRMGLETETTLYSIRFTTGGLARYALAPPLMPGTNAVNKMARETGGEIFEANDGNSIKYALNAVINRLKKRYTLGYSSTNQNQDGKFREISVKLSASNPGSSQNYRIFARRGYYAPISRTASTPKPQ